MPDNKIYLIDTINLPDYDCYDAHVVIAHSSREARNLCFITRDQDADTFTNPKKSKTKYIGQSNLQPHVVLSSLRGV